MRLDASRQSGISLDQIRLDHINRYNFAASRVSGEVLDAACGIGYGSKILQDSGSRVTGIDISEKAIQQAKKYYSGPQYICCDIRDCYLGHFDAVVSFETLEHLSDPRPVVKFFRDCAKKLIASVPNENQYPFVAKNFEWDDYPHFRHYTPDEFDELLNSCGWSVKYRRCQVHKSAKVSDGTDGLFIIYECE